ncbi:MAG: endonuclease/exonuclease/phosphatase family protein [Clostridia bacterium]|nr:endonuclease/exonuclease/phosphatase family protein [Clostridia bacterium]
MKKVWKGLAILLAAAVVVVGGYLAYVFITYYRLPDMIYGVNDEYYKDALPPELDGRRSLDIVTWNLGFGAYSADYSFFMDGGTESRAYSKEAVLKNIGHALDVLEAESPDFMLLQEIDTNSTRSYHVNEAELIRERFDRQVYFAQNYDSPYLFYPILRPHGASLSGLMTLSDEYISKRLRRSLPIESGFMKFLDLDRCYSKSYIEVEGTDRQLILYNLHLSAYTSDGTIATEQLKLLCADMLEEYRSGNYCVAGGDFNKDVLGNSGEVFGVNLDGLTWAQPIEADLVPEGLQLVRSLDADNPVPSCRNADGPYVPGESLVLTVDGFIVSDNVTVEDCRVIDEGFACSDHNPVKMTFTLNE